MSGAAMPGPAPLLHVAQLQAHYGQSHILRGVSL